MPFLIDGKTFFCDDNLLAADHFDVQSHPHPYRVTWTDGDHPVDAILSAFKKNNRNALFIDSHLMRLYRDELASIPPEKILIADATEHFKTLDGVNNVLDFLQKNALTKSDRLIVVGGGIIQEVAAFACAIYKRGIPWVLFPSTLLSMCDSCLGGKASINYHGVKNQLGLFSTPAEIIINPHFLKTLDEDAINSGLGEILKSCIIGGNDLLQQYQSCVDHGKIKSFADIKKLITAALSVKKAVVEADEFESNHRRSLNYGHTLGHAIESLSNYAIPHGQAIVIGMMLENKLSHQQKLMSADDLSFLNTLCLDLMNEKITRILKAISLDNLLDLIQKDKKTTGNTAYFSLMKSAGEVCFVKVVLDECLQGNVQAALSASVSMARSEDADTSPP